MPPVPDEQAVEVAVVLHQEVLDKLAAWTRSVFDEDPEGFLQLFANALVADQALREQIGGMYFGGA
jgi:hypothetical protein